MWVLELNDARIRLFHDGKIVYGEPGVALHIGQQMTYGLEAMRQSRLNPSQCHTLYWQKINTEPAQPKSDGIEYQSDLVFGHLETIKAKTQLQTNDKIWLAVPSDASADQLSLLYGIINHCECEIHDFVDIASSATSTLPVSNNCDYVDVALNRAIVSHLSVTETVSLSSTDTISDSGFLQLSQRWIQKVSELSLDESRFDPRALGSTEQQVFNQIYDGLEDSEPSLNLTITSHGKTWSLAVPKTQLDLAVRDIYAQISAHLTAPTVVLPEAISKFPGLRSELSQDGRHVVVCHDSSVHEAIIDQLSDTYHQSEERSLHSEFAVQKQPNARDRVGKIATHLLFCYEAMPLDSGIRSSQLLQASDGGSDFIIEHGDEGYALLPLNHNAVHLNGRVCTFKTKIFAGDRISVDAHEFLLIAVTGDG